MKTQRNSFFILFLLLTLGFNASGQSMLKDLWPGPTDGFPYYIIGGENNLFFRAESATYGRELWTSDGTPNGTQMLKDINPGSSNSSPTELFRFNDKVYFQADDGTHGYELWMSDGTTNGTQLVKDIRSGGNWSDSGPYSFTKVGNKFVFVAEESSYQFEPWVSDGTANGTMRLKDICPGTGASLSWLYTKFFPMGGNLYFAAYSPNYGIELWKTDGTTNGTVLVKDIRTGVDNGMGFDVWMAEYDGELFFEADNGSGIGKELWKTDGTANGTVLVKDIYPGAFDSDVRDVVSYNSGVMFTAIDGVHGRELWTTDGTSNGTVMIKDLWPGATHGSPNFLTHFDERVFFTNTDSLHGREIWVSDGTSQGTKLFYDFYPGPNYSYPGTYWIYADRLYVSARLPTTVGTEAWVIDGDSANTQILKDIWPGTGSSGAGVFGAWNEKIYFHAKSPNVGAELWHYDPCLNKGINKNVLKMGDSLVSINNGVSYQWYYCDANELTPMDSATDSIFSPQLSGSYTVQLTGKGCIKTSTCTYVKKDLPIYVSNDTVFTEPINGATYQWYDCDSELIISGQTNVNFNATNTGNYAVIITLNGITDTTDCVLYESPNSISEMSSTKSIRIYPNPFEDILIIESTSNSMIQRVQLNDMQGRLIYEFDLKDIKSQIYLSTFEDGIYILRIESNRGIDIRKVIKKSR